MKKLFYFILLLAFTIAGVFYACLKPGVTKVGERTFYKDSDLELKVVLIHQNFPFHYVGPGYSVACKSNNTETFPEWKHDRIEAGWNRLPSAMFGRLDENLNSPLLDRLVYRAKLLYQVKDNSIVVVVGGRYISVTFDKCKSISRWSVDSDLPSEFVVDSTEEYEECLRNQEKDKTAGLTNYWDCKAAKFNGANEPVIQNVVVSRDGSLSFRLISSAIKQSGEIFVHTHDFGRSWGIVSPDML